MTIGKNIKKFRKEKNYTQQDLGDFLYMSRQAIAKWENDYSQPSIENIKKISEFLEVPLEDLIGYEQKDNIVDSRIDLIKKIDVLLPMYEARYKLIKSIEQTDSEIIKECKNIIQQKYIANNTKSKTVSILKSLTITYLLIILLTYLYEAIMSLSLTQFELTFEIIKSTVIIPFGLLSPSISIKDKLIPLIILIVFLIISYKFYKKITYIKPLDITSKMLEDTYYTNTNEIQHLNHKKSVLLKTLSEFTNNHSDDLDYIPNKYSDPYSINNLRDLLINQRAHSLTEAINIYEVDLHQNNMRELAEQTMLQSEMAMHYAQEAAEAASRAEINARNAADSAEYNSFYPPFYRY